MVRNAYRQVIRVEMSKITVIIADDHELFRQGTRNLIENEEDIEVVGEAVNGKEAIEMVEKLKPDIVLMDISMPEVNGIEATKRIKNIRPSTAVIILTAYDNDKYISALLEAGAAGYLLKNVRGTELINAIRSVFTGESVLHPVIAQKVLSRFAPDRGKHEPVQDIEISERELEILKLAAKGMSNQDIADSVFVSRRTVQTHLANIFRKMDVSSRTEAVLRSIKTGLLSIDDLS